MYKEICKVLSQEKVAPGHFVLTLESPKISKNAKPGQFVQILCADSTEPLLPRPFSFLDADSKKFSILYHMVGKGTEILSKLKKGDTLSVLGPCGNGFGLRIEDGGWRIGKRQYLMVGGGVGIPPLYHFSKQLIKNKISNKNIYIFLGARDKSLLLHEKEFKKLGVHLYLATDDGSCGHKGFVTQPLENFLSSILHPPSSIRIYTCGPTPMMKAVSKIAQKFEGPCEVSVEVPMACGFGACLGCAVTVRDEGSTGHRHAIACCEGPVFRGESIVWD